MLRAKLGFGIREDVFPSGGRNARSLGSKDGWRERDLASGDAKGNFRVWARARHVPIEFLAHENRANKRCSRERDPARGNVVPLMGT